MRFEKVNIWKHFFLHLYYSDIRAPDDNIENMVDNEGVEQHDEIDDVSRLQAKLDDLGVMFYTYLGIIQRDAPPSERPPDEADERTNDQKLRDELREKTPGFAKSIVRTSVEIEKLIDDIQIKMKTHSGRERQLLDTADFQSKQAGKEMIQSVDNATKLLTSIRQAIAVHENEP